MPQLFQNPLWMQSGTARIDFQTAQNVQRLWQLKAPEPFLLFPGKAPDTPQQGKAAITGQRAQRI